MAMTSASPLTPGYTLSFDKDWLQLDVIHGFLTHSYWSPGIDREVVETAIANSLTVGAYDAQRRQVGFARLVTDAATFGYLADVFVLEDHRRRGLAQALVKALLDRPEVRKFRRLLLSTKDAHAVYARCGFEPVTDPAPFMQILRPNVYLEPLEGSR